MHSLKELVDSTAWQRTLQTPPSALSLDQLLRGEIAGLCIPDFLDQGECLALKARADDLEFKDYLRVEPKIGRVGVTVFEYDSIGKKEYFEAGERAARSMLQIADGLSHPLERVMEWMRSISPEKQVDRAYEDGYGFYFAGLLRRIESGTLIHVDFAPIEQPNWGVSKVTCQLAFNLYLDVPTDNPGVVRVWNRQWDRESQKFKIPNSYGYQEGVIENIPFAEIVPARGMLMLINTKHFHQVSPASGVRLAVSSAVGLTPEGQLVLWS